MATAKTVTASAVVLATPCDLWGWSLRESAGTPAVARTDLYDNASAASGTLLATIVFLASGNSQVNFPVPIHAKLGIFAGAGAGAVTGSAYIS